MSGPTNGYSVPAAVERFVKQLVITYKAVTLYPPASAIPRENAADAAELLEVVLSDDPDMRLVVTKDALHFEGTPINPGQAAFVGFAQELYNRAIAEVRFHAGADREAIVTFLGVIKTPAEELTESGGVSARLWDSGVDVITVTEIVAAVLGEEDQSASEEGEGEQWPPDHLVIEEVLTAASAGLRFDRRMLVRVIKDPQAVASYLGGAFDRLGGDPAQAAEQIDIATMAGIADSESGQERSRALTSLAEAVGSLAPERRRALVALSLLPVARSDESVAALVRQLGVDAVCMALVEGLEASEVSKDALARALRNLALISMAGRDEVLDAAGAAMRSADFDEDTVEAVLEAVAPSRLVERSHDEEGPAEPPAESILRLLDIAPSVSGTGTADPGLETLREEASAGISDGEILASLVTVATAESDRDGFAQAMAQLEGSLGLLIERGEFEVAADAAEALVRAADSAPSERRTRFSAAIGRLAGAGEMRSVHQALRLYRPGTPEHDGCMRFLGALGTFAIDPLLEVLADEPNMAARKSLVDLISTVADRHIQDVGERVEDPRWYVVRNVVSILGATRRREVLPYLGRTLRHSDVRVRRETIRAVSGISDALVVPMLVSALEDTDAQNVQLAARYLGRAGDPSAVRALMRVANGEGRGNRDQGPRVEAIEALGALGATEALPILKSLAGRRRRISGRSRPIAAAASGAVAKIETSGEEAER